MPPVHQRHSGAEARQPVARGKGAPRSYVCLHVPCCQPQLFQLDSSTRFNVTRCDAGRKVERLTKFCDSAAFFCRPDFVQARGVHYLVELATSHGSDVDEVRGARSSAPGAHKLNE